MTHLDLFSGIGGFALAARWAGFETVQFVEYEPYAQKVLAKNFPGVPIAGDIFEFDATKFLGVGLVTGGFPCQPFSQAGKRLGSEDDRAIWPQMLRVIREARPTWVLGENVSGIITMELDNVLSDLEGEGYTTQTLIIPATGVDARHRRERVWIVANSQYSSDRTKRGEEREEESIQGVNRQERCGRLPGGTGSNSRVSKQSLQGTRTHGQAQPGKDVAHSKSNRWDSPALKEMDEKESRRKQGCRPDNSSKDVAHSECKRLEGFRGESGEKRQVGRSGDVANTSIFRSKTGIPGSQQGEEGFTGIINNSCSETGGGERCSTGLTQPRLGGTLSDGISTWMDEPDIPRVGVKIPDRAKRLKAIGNAIVPAVAYEIIRHMKEVT